MAKKILNKHNQLDVPTLILQNRNFDNIGTIVDACDLTYKESLNTANELSFTLYKNTNVNRNSLWNKIVSGKILYLPEFQEKFEITISTTAENGLSKSITATSLCECELSQIKLYHLEVNTETDISHDDYKVTVFYNPEDTTHSLLHRILSEKAPHYSIAHVDDSLKTIQKMDLSFTDVDVYSLLTGDISDTFGCIFIFNSMDRTISVYDIYNTCHKCQYRGNFSEKCPQCESTDFSGQYGKDTTVFISNENLATSITLEPDWNALKNCFYVEGGDDVIAAAFRFINPNGTQYIYNFDETKKDMPDELEQKITSYFSNYNHCMKTQTFALDKNIVRNYNNVVNYINHTFAHDENIHYPTLNTTIIGFPAITSAVYDAIDLYHFVANSMMPTIETDHMSLQDSLKNIVDGFHKEFPSTNDTVHISLLNCTSATKANVENEILKAAKLFYSTAHYKLEVTTNSYQPAFLTDNVFSDGIWMGTFTITSLTEKDTDGVNYKSVTSSEIEIRINDNYESYIRQKIAKGMADKERLAQKDIKSLPKILTPTKLTKNCVINTDNFTPKEWH